MTKDTKKLKCGKIVDICTIIAEMGKARTEVMHELHAVLSAFWQSYAILLDWKNGLVVPISKGKADPTAVG